ncbi:DUF2491 family protein [Uliginosibacterium gangwonense]|uniref:DUF2491 family protein n=1 Tax=Uliginosibacterium gangwonense TaxID=392736 RepID=UPI00037EC51E|nr:DUF2491 family protein [Uliginosibacterium gangwonense]
MGWFNLGKRILEKQAAVREQEAQAKAISRLATQDEGLPLGLSIGSMFGIPRADFAVLQGGLITTPPAAEFPVISISRVKLEDNPDLPIYRFYTDVGRDRLGQGEAFLQVFGAAGAIEEIGYYQFLYRLIPQTEEEQRLYMGEGYGLGETDYYLSADQLAALGIPSARIEEALAGEDCLHYTRDVPGGDYISPFCATETRLDDQAGVSGLRQEIRFMPYVRTLPDGNKEHLLISFEILESLDGARKQQIHVDFMIGLTIDPLRLKTY